MLEKENAALKAKLEEAGLLQPSRSPTPSGVPRSPTPNGDARAPTPNGIPWSVLHLCYYRVSYSAGSSARRSKGTFRDTLLDTDSLTGTGLKRLRNRLSKV